MLGICLEFSASRCIRCNIATFLTVFANANGSCFAFSLVFVMGQPRPTTDIPPFGKELLAQVPNIPQVHRLCETRRRAKSFKLPRDCKLC